MIAWAWNFKSYTVVISYTIIAILLFQLSTLLKFPQTVLTGNVWRRRKSKRLKCAYVWSDSTYWGGLGCGEAGGDNRNFKVSISGWFAWVKMSIFKFLAQKCNLNWKIFPAIARYTALIENSTKTLEIDSVLWYGKICSSRLTWSTLLSFDIWISLQNFKTSFTLILIL